MARRFFDIPAAPWKPDLCSHISYQNRSKKGQKMPLFSLMKSSKSPSYLVLGEKPCHFGRVNEVAIHLQGLSVCRFSKKMGWSLIEICKDLAHLDGLVGRMMLKQTQFSTPKKWRKCEPSKPSICRTQLMVEVVPHFGTSTNSRAVCQQQKSNLAPQKFRLRRFAQVFTQAL